MLSHTYEPTHTEQELQTVVGAVGCFSLAENRLLGILQVRSNTTCHLCRADNRKQRKNYNGFATTIPFACIHVLS